MAADPEPGIHKNASSEQRNGPAKMIGNYTLQQSLGKGSMGKVKLGVHNVTSEKVQKKETACQELKSWVVIDCREDSASS